MNTDEILEHRKSVCDGYARLFGNYDLMLILNNSGSAINENASDTNIYDLSIKIDPILNERPIFVNPNLEITIDSCEVECTNVHDTLNLMLRSLINAQDSALFEYKGIRLPKKEDMIIIELLVALKDKNTDLIKSHQRLKCPVLLTP